MQQQHKSRGRDSEHKAVKAGKGDVADTKLGRQEEVSKRAKQGRDDYEEDHDDAVERDKRQVPLRVLGQKVLAGIGELNADDGCQR